MGHAPKRRGRPPKALPQEVVLAPEPMDGNKEKENEKNDEQLREEYYLSRSCAASIAKMPICALRQYIFHGDTSSRLTQSLLNGLDYWQHLHPNFDGQLMIGSNLRIAKRPPASENDLKLLVRTIPAKVAGVIYDHTMFIRVHYPNVYKAIYCEPDELDVPPVYPVEGIEDGKKVVYGMTLTETRRKVSKEEARKLFSDISVSDQANSIYKPAPSSSPRTFELDKPPFAIPEEHGIAQE